ncbi:hypothetical protein K7432_007946 [Basidiobolus ranarum]|uniref:SEC7 domain-containing protein n=1 Tax=Basidiobolus ranarum TaxID=34480 RepID=A0ABR2VZJ3_9FUNG
MEDSISPSLSDYSSNNTAPTNNTPSSNVPKNTHFPREDLSIQTGCVEQSMFNSAPVGFGFLEAKDKGRESPVSPTSNKLKRTAAIRVNKILSNNSSRKNSLDKQEQRKERTKLLRRSVSLNDSETILEHVSMSMKTNQDDLSDKLKYKKQQIRKSKSCSEEFNLSVPGPEQLEHHTEISQLTALDDERLVVHSPITSCEDSNIVGKLAGCTNNNSMEMQETTRPFARRSRSFNVTPANPNRNAELLRTYSHPHREKESSGIYLEGPLGFWSQKFNVTKEPPTDRISGIMKSWKIHDFSSITLLPFVSDETYESDSVGSLNSLSSDIPRALSVKGKIHKPKVSRIVIQNPSESRAMFQSALPEELISSTTLQIDEYRGLFPLGKEIKASRVQLNFRSSLEMRLTKEKLRSVIVEDVNEQTLNINSPPTTCQPTITLLPKEMEEKRRSIILRKGVTNTLLEREESTVRVIEVGSNPGSSLPPCDVGPSFRLTTLTEKLKLSFPPDSSSLLVSPKNESCSEDKNDCSQKKESLLPDIQTLEIDNKQKIVKDTPNDENFVDAPIDIDQAKKDIESWDNGDSIADITTSEGDSKLRNQSVMPRAKRITIVEPVGVTKGILPHLKKKKPSVLVPSSSFRRNSRRIAPSLPRIDASMSRQSFIKHYKAASVETVSSNESSTLGFTNHIDEMSQTSRIKDMIASSTTASTAALYNCSLDPIRELELYSKAKAKSANNADQVVKKKALSHSTKRAENASRNSRLISRLNGDSSTATKGKSSLPALDSQPDSKSGPSIKTRDTENGVVSNEPRSVIHHGFALQIINSSAAKNRYLLLMDDILLIAKPMSRESPQNYSLNSHFAVKHIIDLSTISFSASREKERHGRKIKEDTNNSSPSQNPTGELHPLIASAVRQFNANPYEGIMYMIDKGALRADPLSIASFLLRTPELSRRQIGKFLGMQGNHAILHSYLDKCKFAGLRIDDALRVFLASFRLPGEGNIIDYLVGAFARRWHRTNSHNMTFDAEASIRLAFFMMALNAETHTRKTTKPKMELVEFLGRLQAMDSTSMIPENLLIHIYQSIRHDKLETAMENREYQSLPIDIRFPSDHHLVIGENSALITITIPTADKDLRIKPVGDGLVCDIPFLDFTHTNCHTFTVKATSLGRKSLIFIKLGTRNRKYTSIASWTLVVEPPLMQHTFQIGFPGETNKHPRKKFMFGVETSVERTSWLEKITTTFARTFNHTNSELDIIIRRLRNHLIIEDSSHSLVVSGHELVQCLQAPITSTTLPELRASAIMKYSINASNKSTLLPHTRSQSSRSSSGKRRSNPPSSQHSRTKPSSNAIRSRNEFRRDSYAGKGPRTSQFAINTGSSSGKSNYGLDSGPTSGAKFRIRAG